MTKEEILAMQPSEELDVLVSEGIMGRPRPDFIPEHALELALAGTPVRYNGWLCICFYDEGDVPKWIPDPYSTDIEAAWPVVEKMKGEGYEPVVNWLPDYGIRPEGWHVNFWKEQEPNNDAFSCEDAPEAICKAALLTRLAEIKRLEGGDNDRGKQAIPGIPEG